MACNPEGLQKTLDVGTIGFIDFGSFTPVRVLGVRSWLRVCSFGSAWAAVDLCDQSISDVWSGENKREV